MKFWLSIFLCVLGVSLGGTAHAAPSLLLDNRVSNTNPDLGETFRYTIRYRCASLTENCTGAQIVNTVPADLNIQRYSPAAGNIASLSKSGNTLTWTFTDPLPAGSTGALNITVNFPSCGDTQPAAVTNSATFTATNASTVNANAPVVTLNGVLPACPPPPPAPTTAFNKSFSQDLILNGNVYFSIGSDSTAATDYVVEDYFPPGMVITKIPAYNWPTGFEIQCGGTANWYTIPPNTPLTDDISGFADCVSVSGSDAVAGAQTKRYIRCFLYSFCCFGN